MASSVRLKTIKYHSEFHFSFRFLNIVHLTGAMYLTVLSTKWISDPLTPAEGRSASRELDYWIQVTALWTMLALFAWTLVAPVLFKNRNFVWSGWFCTPQRVPWHFPLWSELKPNIISLIISVISKGGDHVDCHIESTMLTVAVDNHEY